MTSFFLWCILLVLCWPLALLAVVLYPIVWLLLLPFRLFGIAVGGGAGAAGRNRQAPGARAPGAGRRRGTENALRSPPEGCYDKHTYKQMVVRGRAPVSRSLEAARIP